MYQEIVVGILPNAKESIHLEDYPIAGNIDQELLLNMIKLRDLCSLGLAIRNENSLPVRQPLAYVATNLKDLELQQVLKEELNCKEVRFQESFEGLASKFSENGTVALDINLTQELTEEGQLADLTRKIQNARKNAGLTMGQKVVTYYSTDSSSVKGFITKFESSINKITSLESLTSKDNIEGETVKFLGDKFNVQFEL
jgi:isoleucyl-tRNA synthetase